MSLAPMPALSARQLSKAFSTVPAVDRVTIDFHAGEIHAILGENGAGKSTLMHLLAGLHRPDAGEILLNGTRVSFSSPRSARAAGIAMVHQHFMLIPSLSVAENILLALPGRRWQRLHRQRLSQDIQALATRYGLAIGALDTPVASLSVGTQQRVEILKALASSARILILDEPTAVLTPSEVENLFVILRKLRSEGYCILLITHKIPEVLALADRLSILRRGRLVTTRELSADTAADELATLMIGEPQTVPSSAAATNDTPEPEETAPSPSLTLDHVSTRAAPGRVALRDVSLTISSGAIVGIAGVDGNGQAELAELLLGLRRPTRGEIRIQGHPVHPFTPDRLRAAGVAVIPHDRRHEGLALSLSIEENLLLNTHLLSTFAPGVYFSPRHLRRFAEQQIMRFSIHAVSPAQTVAALSGGNQQRVVIARELAQDPKILVAANPSRGLDISATTYVHHTLRAHAARGAGVLLISTDLDEVIALSTRVHVLYQGRLLGPVHFPADRTIIGRMMTGTRTPC
jgi:general nucleoside transport system ATP-binding protein